MKIVFVLAAFCFSLGAFSQKGDYLVKNNGDTIWGDITLKNKIFYVNGTTPEVVKADEVTTISSVNYKGSAVVHCNLLTYIDNLGDLEIDYIEKGSTDTVMILKEIYATPKIILYYTQNNFKTPFYFYKTPADPKPIQLVIRYFLQGGLANYNNDRAKFRGDKSKVQIAEDKGYVNQLKALMGQCKNIPEAMWEQLSYRDYSLKKVIKRYNNCD
ncbi:MAG: hypothetical protein ABI685_12440 [Ferruginibacter sp.]